MAQQQLLMLQAFDIGDTTSLSSQHIMADHGRSWQHVTPSGQHSPVSAHGGAPHNCCQCLWLTSFDTSRTIGLLKSPTCSRFFCQVTWPFQPVPFMSGFHRQTDSCYRSPLVLLILLAELVHYFLRFILALKVPERATRFGLKLRV